MMDVPELPNFIHYAIPFFIITIIIEIIVDVREKSNAYQVKDSVTSISMGLGNLLVGVLAKGIQLGAYVLIYENLRLFTIPFVWWAWLLILVLDDFIYYCFHRTSHESRFFWASHVVHHSSQKYNLSTALRQTWSGAFFSFVFWLPLPFLGFHPVMILAQMSISLIYQYWIHTEFIDKMPGWFEAIFNTPSHHRVHHAVNPQYLDRNHGGIFIIWDKWLGTFTPEIEKPTYGLVKNISSFNPLYVAFHEWITMFRDVFKSETTLTNRLRYLFKPPGWKHDGTGKMSNDIRREWKQKRNTVRKVE